MFETKRVMTSIDLELIVIIFFWVGMWGAIQTVADWLFEQMGPEDTYGNRFLTYMILVLGGLCVLNYLLCVEEDDPDKPNDNNDDNNDGRG